MKITKCYNDYYYIWITDSVNRRIQTLRYRALLSPDDNHLIHSFSHFDVQFE